MASNASTPSAEDKARKVRSLLASYYTAENDDQNEGLSNRIDDSPSRTPSSARSLSTQLSRAESAAATQLNATYFDPEAYLRRLLKDTRLGDLTNKHRAMLAEVGSLDSDMQMLVYENYNKFVTATDTIKVMNASMGGMDTNMNTLKDLIDGVVDRSNAVNGKLQHRQEHIEELNQVRMLLHKLQGVFDLPKKLRAAIDRGAYEVAVESYADVAPLFKKFGHKGAFKKVGLEVEACAKELSGILRQRLLAHPDEAAECIQMIAKLGEMTESLQEDFLTCKRQRMEGWLQTAGLALKTIAVGSGLLDPKELGSVDELLRQRLAEWFPPGGGQPSVYKVLIELDSRFLTELTHTAAMYAQLFEPGGRKKLVKMARDVFQRYLKLARRALADTAATAAAAAAGISTQGDLLVPLGDLLEEMQRQEEEGGLAPPAAGPASGIDLSISADWGTKHLMQSLYVVKNDISRLDSMLPELSPKDRAGEIVEHTVRQHVGLCFAALERRVLGTIQAIRGALEAAGQNGSSGLAERQDIVQRGLLILQDIVMQGADRVLVSLKEYERERWALQSWQDVFASLVQGQLQNLFLSISHAVVGVGAAAAAGGEPAPCAGGAASAVQDIAGAGAGAPVTSSPVTVEATAHFAALSRRQSLQPPATPGGGEAPPPPGLLLLLLCRLCQVLEGEALAHVLGSLQELFPGRLGGLGRDEPPAFVAGELGRQLGGASGALLQAYVDSYGRLLAIAVRRGMEATDWVNHKEPRAPRLVCDYILEKAAEADAEIACLTEARSARHSRSSSIHQLAHSGSGAMLAAPSIGGGGGASGFGSSGLGPAASSGLGGGLTGRESGAAASLEAAVSKVFSQRDGPGALELGRASLLAAILCQALRSLVEAVRLATLGRAGFQQIQLDVHYLRPRLQQYAAGGAGGAGGLGAGGREVMALLDELLGAAMERCSQPLMLDTAVLDRIVAQAAAAQKQQQAAAAAAALGGGFGGPPSLL